VPDYAAYEAEVVEFVRRYVGKALGEVHVGLAVTEGIGKQLDPKLDRVHEALPFFMTLRQAGRL
jgi:hypothetical protein